MRGEAHAVRNKLYLDFILEFELKCIAKPDAEPVIMRLQWLKSSCFDFVYGLLCIFLTIYEANFLSNFFKYFTKPLLINPSKV